MQSLKEFWSAVRLVSTPLIVIESHDEIATYKNLLDYCNESQLVPVWQWDCAQGYKASNELADSWENRLEGREQVEDSLLELAIPDRIPAMSVVVMHWRQEFWQGPQVRQALINLRERFKKRTQACVLLIPFASEIPADVRVHILAHKEALPDALELGSIAEKATASARTADPSIEHLEGEKREKVVSILKGMSAFQAEQQAFMALRKRVGIHTDILQESKIDLINSTPGLSCWQGTETFHDVVGLVGIQSYIEELVAGEIPIRLVIWVDEIEKAIAGNQGDTSGVSQDFMGYLLSHLVNTEAMAILLFGQPGTGKSLVAKATGAHAKTLTIQLDIGGMKNSLVGESEARLRRALAIEQAISEVGHTLWLCTCNGTSTLPSALRSRFMAEFFYDFPTPQSQAAMWQYYIDKYQLKDEIPALQPNWTGREIARACRTAWQLRQPLQKAIKRVIPIAVSAWEESLNRKKEAHLRFHDAQGLGVYRMPSEHEESRAIAFGNN